MLFFIVLSGSSKNPSFPLDKFYWVEGDTSAIAGAPTTARWAFWGVCEKVGSSTKNCSSLGPAIAISPVDNFGTESGVPQYFIDNRDTFYYLSRVGWSTIIVALVFTIISLFLTVFLICSYQVQKITALFSFVGTLMNFAAAALLTAAIVLTKKHLSSGKIGPSLMGLLWASATCNLIVSLTTFGACVRESYLRAKDKYAQESLYTETKPSESSGAVPVAAPPAQAPSAIPYEDPYTAAGPENHSVAHSEPRSRSGINFFKINRNRKADEESEI